MGKGLKNKVPAFLSEGFERRYLKGKAVLVLGDFRSRSDVLTPWSRRRRDHRAARAELQRGPDSGYRLGRLPALVARFAVRVPPATRLLTSRLRRAVGVVLAQRDRASPAVRCTGRTAASPSPPAPSGRARVPGTAGRSTSGSAGEGRAGHRTPRTRRGRGRAWARGGRAARRRPVEQLDAPAEPEILRCTRATVLLDLRRYRQNVARATIGLASTMTPPSEARALRT